MIPEGFGDISTEENSPIDLFYHEEYLGSFIATFDDDFFTFDNPSAVMEKLTFVERPELFLTELSKTLEPNIELVCNEIDKRKCKFINPDVVGVILDRNKYNVYLFVNYKFLKPAAPPDLKYIQDADNPFSVTGKRSLFVKSVYKKTDNTSITTMTLNNISAFSKNNYELKIFSIGSLGFDQKFKSTELPLYKMNRAVGNYRAKENIISVGTVSTNGSFLIPTSNVLGVLAQTDTTLIVNPHVQYGTPIQV
ncbi:MAG: hypothetical protein HRT87_10775, partial [Legionellales bacterium]|nr:hypothetical protein [Legionellales bacterium]